MLHRCLPVKTSEKRRFLHVVNSEFRTSKHIVRFLRLFALFDLIGSNILISNADLLEVWRKQRSFCEKQNSIYTVISDKIDGNVLEENHRY